MPSSLVGRALVAILALGSGSVFSPAPAWAQDDEPDRFAPIRVSEARYPLLGRARTLGSGTSLLPRLSPLRLWAFEAGDWLVTVQGDLVGGYNYQGGRHGSQSWVAENWQGVIGTRTVGPGILDLRLMTSLEPWTMPPGGTAQLLQTGETYLGVPLVDKQHPQELLMELTSRYTWNLTPSAGLFAYGGLVGDPALGPPAFLQRPSAADNRKAPLGHHLQDSSHVSAGVATLGGKVGDFQAEGSVFNGREPGENHANIEFAPLDSWSSRLSYVPGKHWAFQVSTGRLTDPIRLEPGIIQRYSISAMQVSTFAKGSWSTCLIWGQSVEGQGLARTLKSFAIESQMDWADANHVYVRIEEVDRLGLLDGVAPTAKVSGVGAVTLGALRDLNLSDAFDLGVGGDLTVSSLDATLEKVYGSRPFAFRVFLRLRPPTTRQRLAEDLPIR